MAWFGAWLVLSGCVQEMAPGPDLGACAEPPDGVYGYGEAGIGTCLAGPAGMAFFEQGGGEWLAVTNADPFRLYRTGSVLVIDWDDLAARLADAPTEIPMDEVTATSLEIFDSDDGDTEGSNPFLGGIAYLPDAQALVAPGRYSEDGDYANAPILRSSKDDAWVVDTSSLGTGALALAESVQLEDDPYPIVPDAAAGRVYVGNLTDHSVSVLDVAPADPILTEVDVAPGATTTKAPLIDADASGSLGEVSVLDVLTPKDAVADQWTLTYVEQTVKLWVAADNGDLVGLRQYTTGDLRTYQPSAFPVELGLGGVSSPFVTLGTNGAPWLFYGVGATINVAISALPYQDGVWLDAQDPFTFGPGVGAPSVAPLLSQAGYYLFAQHTAEDAETSSIAYSTSPDMSSWGALVDVLVPPEGVSYEQPFVALDGITGTYRMWLSIHDGDQFDIGYAESADGETWSEPEIIIPSDGTYTYAAPAVALLEGPRYTMWLSRDDGTRWDTAFAQSYDGRHWTTPEKILDPQTAEYNAARPPRPAVFVNYGASTTGTTGGWSLTGGNTGFVAGLLHAGRPPSEIGGFELGVAHGHIVSNSVVPDRRASAALIPGSAIVVGGRQRLYATAFDGTALADGTFFGTPRIVVLDRDAAAFDPTAPPPPWELLVDGDEMDLSLAVGDGEHVSDPVIAEDGAGFVLFYAVDDGERLRIRRATSPDGLDFTPDAEFLLADDPAVSFDEFTQRPHSLEITAGAVRLWYSGSDGALNAIGVAAATDLRGDFAREPGPSDDWRLAGGELGSFDGDGVKDPLVVTVDGVTHLFYAGFDGTEWRIGRRTVEADGSLSDPRRDPIADDPMATLIGRSLTFAELGVDSPVLLAQDDASGVLTFAYAGYDSVPTVRVGEAQADYAQLDVIFPKMRFPTAGDELSFTTDRGGAGVQVIELAQTTDTFVTNGYGMSSMALDEARGFLYVTSKLSSQLYVLDVRDDSSGSFVDSNYLDLEAVLPVTTGSSASGFRDVVVAPGRGLVYLTQRLPDALVVIDPAQIADDGIKQLELGATLAVIPLQSAVEDAGADTNPSTLIGGDGMALTADESQLLVTNFRGNALSVFDLDAGSWATEVAFLPNIGENPHLVRISPDGRYAVVANYVGSVEGDVVSATLAIVDLDPASATYLEIVTWLVN